MIHSRSVVFLILSFLCCSVLCVCVDNANYTLASDASYWYNNTQRKDILLWKEWWFFTLIDPASGYSFICAYAMVDPNATLPINVAVESMTYSPTGDNWQTQDTFPLSALHDSPFNASLSIGANNYITVLDAQTYRVVGRSDDGRAAWDLRYTQTHTPIQEDIVLPQTGIDMGWIGFMPSASVVGNLTLKGQNISVNGTGYHDHNYGIYGPLFNWIWLQLGSQDFTLVMGAYKVPFTSDYVGDLWIRFKANNSQEVKLKLGTTCGDKFSFVSLKSEKRFGLYNDSTDNAVSASSESGWSISFQYAMQTEQVNDGGLGFPLMVFEQLSLFQGTLSFNGALVRTFGGIGFSEWCDHLV